LVALFSPPHSFLLRASSTNSFAHAPWVTLHGGHYFIKRPNDGDSFHVSVEGHEYIFRLHFVDAPEARPFKSANDLRRVKGIGGGKRYEKIRPFFN